MPHENKQIKRTVGSEEILANPTDMPVVARMVVEIRSDGNRTMARGAIEDFNTGERIAIETRALSLLELSVQLSKGLLASGAVARQAVKSLVPGRLRKLLRRRQGPLK